MAKKQVSKTSSIKTGPTKTKQNESPPSVKQTKADEVKNILEAMGGKIPVADRVGPSKGKKFSETKYIRICEDEGIEKFKEMSDRIQNKSIQWAFYAVDGDKGYHYYLILK